MRKFEHPGGVRPREFPEVTARLSRAEYEGQVVAFAREARQLIERTPKQVAANEDIPGEFAEFWSQFDGYLRRYGVTELPALPVAAV